MKDYDYDYFNDNKQTFICLPSTNFGYGYPTNNAGFICIQNSDNDEQTIINEIF